MQCLMLIGVGVIMSLATATGQVIDLSDPGMERVSTVTLFRVGLQHADRTNATTHGDQEQGTDLSSTIPLRYRAIRPGMVAIDPFTIGMRAKVDRRMVVFVPVELRDGRTPMLFHTLIATVTITYRL